MLPDEGRVETEERRAEEGGKGNVELWKGERENKKIYRPKKMKMKSVHARVKKKIKGN